MDGEKKCLMECCLKVPSWPGKPTVPGRFSYTGSSVESAVKLAADSIDLVIGSCVKVVTTAGSEFPINVSKITII